MCLKTDIFPINYFKSIWNPLTAFKNRFKLNTLMMIVIFIFLNALMVIPVTLNYAKMDTFPLEEYYPNAVQMLDDETVNTLQETTVDQGELFIETPFIIENDYGVIAGGLTETEFEEVVESPNFILFGQNQFVIGEEDYPTGTIPYTRDFTLEGVDTVEELESELSRQWFNQNRMLVVLVFSLMIGVFLIVMNVLLVLGSALLIYFTRSGQFTTISTYKESVNLMLNSLGVPTLIAMVFGLFYFDMFLMVTIQSLGLVVYLIIIWAKVQFNDYNLEKRMEKNE